MLVPLEGRRPGGRNDLSQDLTLRRLHFHKSPAEQTFARISFLHGIGNVTPILLVNARASHILRVSSFHHLAKSQSFSSQGGEKGESWATDPGVQVTNIASGYTYDLFFFFFFDYDGSIVQLSTVRGTKGI